jgi:hypothetical protein
MQVSLCQTGELFLEASSSRAPLLFSTLLAVTPATQLFGGIPQPERELALWKEQREALEERVTPLSGRAITEAALTWLQVSTSQDIIRTLQGTAKSLNRHAQKLCKLCSLVLSFLRGRIPFRLKKIKALIFLSLIELL